MMNYFNICMGQLQGSICNKNTKHEERKTYDVVSKRKIPATDFGKSQQYY